MSTLNADRIDVGVLTANHVSRLRVVLTSPWREVAPGRSECSFTLEPEVDPDASGPPVPP